MSALLSGETLEHFSPRSQYIFDASGNIVGLQNPRAVGADFRPIMPMTWAERPTVNIPPALFLFTDIGSSGTLMRYAGSRWRPLAGQAMLASLGATVTGITNTETIFLQTLIPAGAWQTNDLIRITVAGAKSGATDIGVFTVRVGTAGTTADTSVFATTAMSAAGRTYGTVKDLKLTSATNSQDVPVYIGASSSALLAAVAISNASSNALYVSLSWTSGGTTDTISALTGTIQLITP